MKIKNIYRAAATVSGVLFLFGLNLPSLKTLSTGDVLQLLPGIIMFSFLPLILSRIFINSESIEGFKRFRSIHKEYKKIVKKSETVSENA